MCEGMQGFPHESGGGKYPLWGQKLGVTVGFGRDNGTSLPFSYVSNAQRSVRPKPGRWGGVRQKRQIAFHDRQVRAVGLPTIQIVKRVEDRAHGKNWEGDCCIWHRSQAHGGAS